MKDTSLAIKVGLFVLLGIAIIGLTTLFIGQYRITSGGGYTLYAEFSDVSGLNVMGSVRIAGVKVGDVAFEEPNGLHCTVEGEEFFLAQFHDGPPRVG